ncbi:MAG: hypothetical protein WBG37_22025 [Desulfobacterales bacterium]|jgi:hypothetical protein
MPQPPTIAALIREHKTLFLILAVITLLIEAEIFAVAAMKSGRSAVLQIQDSSGNVLHETDGNNLSTFDKYYFEQAFGPLENYEVKLITRTRPFPFRAWLAAAVGLPVGAILLFAFIVRAYMSIFYGDHKSDPAEDHGRHPSEASPTSQSELGGRWSRILARISRFNIFILGFLVVLGAFLYWVIPNMLTYIGRVGLDTLVRYKWLFAALGGVFTALVAWVIYLRYKLASQSIAARAELDRFRLQLELSPEASPPLQLAHRACPPDNATPSQVGPDSETTSGN